MLSMNAKAPAAVRRKDHHYDDGDNDDDEEEFFDVRPSKIAKLSALDSSSGKSLFADPSIAQPFIWAKNKDSDNNGGPSAQAPLEDRIAKLEEMEKSRLLREEDVKKRRMNREEKLREREQDEGYKEWAEQEAQFHVKQTRQRALLRLEGGRGSLCDILLCNIVNEERVLFLTLKPSVLFTTWAREHFKGESEIRREIQVWKEDTSYYMEHDRPHSTYWEHVLKVVSFVESCVNDGESEEDRQMDVVYEKQSLEQLDKMLADVREKAYTDPMNPDFWKRAAARLDWYISRIKLDDMHYGLLRKQLKLPPAASCQDVVSKLLEINGVRQSEVEAKYSGTAVPAATLPAATVPGSLLTLEKPIIYSHFQTSPHVFGLENFPRLHVLSLAAQRLTKEEETKLRQQLHLPSEGDATADGQDSEYDGEVILPIQFPKWSASYDPRKPRYFNYVHYGYEWNRYNRTHYNSDNPPPKMVMGYKFNIFFPDLQDPSKTPSYHVRRDGKEKGTSILTFHSGPPYQDIAFRVVDREWEKSHHRGFRCVFDKGVLQLHFQFKKIRYKN
eukprot:ANDGO_06601.mRNA.1 Cactin